MPYQIAVCGPSRCTPTESKQAFQVGQLLAQKRAIVLCGGGTGVMASVAAGVRAEGGTVIGIRPGPDHDGASPDLSATIITNMGEARNAIIVWSADAVIVVGGSWGTLSELALAKKRSSDIPIVSLGGWRILDDVGKEVGDIAYVDTPAHAVQEVSSRWPEFNYEA
jgi:uncharacterized protein (TIGR00725 family)